MYGMQKRTVQGLFGDGMVSDVVYGEESVAYLSNVYPASTQELRSCGPVYKSVLSLDLFGSEKDFSGIVGNEFVQGLFGHGASFGVSFVRSTQFGLIAGSHVLLADGRRKAYAIHLFDEGNRVWVNLGCGVVAPRKPSVNASGNLILFCGFADPVYGSSLNTPTGDWGSVVETDDEVVFSVVNGRIFRWAGAVPSVKGGLTAFDVSQPVTDGGLETDDGKCLVAYGLSIQNTLGATTELRDSVSNHLGDSEAYSTNTVKASADHVFDDTKGLYFVSNNVSAIGDAEKNSYRLIKEVDRTNGRYAYLDQPMAVYSTGVLQRPTLSIFATTGAIAPRKNGDLSVLKADVSGTASVPYVMGNGYTAYWDGRLWTGSVFDSLGQVPGVVAATRVNGRLRFSANKSEYASMGISVLDAADTMWGVVGRGGIETWHANATVDTSDGDSGNLVGLHPAQNGLFVIFERAVFLITGSANFRNNSSSSQYRSQLISRVGAASSRSWCASSGGIVIANSNGIFQLSYDSTITSLSAGRVDEYVNANIGNDPILTFLRGKVIISPNAPMGLENPDSDFCYSLVWDEARDAFYEITHDGFITSGDVFESSFGDQRIEVCCTDLHHTFSDDTVDLLHLEVTDYSNGRVFVSDDSFYEYLNTTPFYYHQFNSSVIIRAHDGYIRDEDDVIVGSLIDWFSLRRMIVTGAYSVGEDIVSDGAAGSGRLKLFSFVNDSAGSHVHNFFGTRGIFQPFSKLYTPLSYTDWSSIGDASFDVGMGVFDGVKQVSLHRIPNNMFIGERPSFSVSANDGKPADVRLWFASGFPAETLVKAHDSVFDRRFAVDFSVFGVGVDWVGAGNNKRNVDR